jgi:cytochrome P450
VKEYDNPTGMISYISLGSRRILPYTPAALSFFLNSPNYIKPPRASHFIRILIGDGIITAEYDEHKRQRRILTPAFGVSHIREITPHFWTKANQLTEEWRPLVESKPEEGIDVMKWMNRATLDIIGLAGVLQLNCFNERIWL